MEENSNDGDLNSILSKIKENIGEIQDNLEKVNGNQESRKRIEKTYF